MCIQTVYTVYYYSFLTVDTQSSHLSFFKVGVGEVLPTFQVGNRTSRCIPVEISDWERRNSDSPIQLECTISPKEAGIAYVPISPCVESMAYVTVCPCGDDMAYVPVSPQERDMPAVPLSPSERGVTSVSASPSIRDMVYVPISLCEGGMAFLPVSPIAKGVIGCDCLNVFFLHRIIDHVFRCSLLAVLTVDVLSLIDDRFTKGKFFIFKGSFQRHLSRFSVWPTEIIKTIWLPDFFFLEGKCPLWSFSVVYRPLPTAFKHKAFI